MSTVHSTPSTITPMQRSHPTGFNDQTHHDPFISSIPSEECLIPIVSNHSPSHYLYDQPSPSQTAIHPAGSPLQDQSSYQSSQTGFTTDFGSAQSPYSNVDYEATCSTYDFLSPNAYTSDTGYVASSEFSTTPDFGSNGLYLDDSSGVLVDSQNVELNGSNALPTNQSQQAQNYTQIGATQQWAYPRASAGAATLSSHLMSPVLTDSGRSISRPGTNSPPDSNRIKNEGHEQVSSSLGLHDSSSGTMDHALGPSQITPSVTESSQGTSPDPPSIIPNTTRAASPMIRVEGFSRGDSPARGPALSPRKRSRAGSSATRLTVQQSHDEARQPQRLYHQFGDTQGAIDHDTGRTGLDPDERNDVSNTLMSSLKEQELQAQVVLKNIDVEEWLDRSRPASDDKPDVSPIKATPMNPRQRAKSAGTQILSQANLESLKNASAATHIPGPGLLINEESGDDDDYNADGTASIDDSPPPTITLREPVNETPGEAKPGVYDELPNQPPLYRAKLWQDPLSDSSDPGVKMQPETANAAIMRYEQRAGDIETMSRVATWGTRRLSESDVNSLFHQLSFSERDQEPAKGKRDRRGSFLHQLSGRLGSKKSHSNLRRQDSEKSIKSKDQSARPSATNHDRKDSVSSRKESLGVPNTPSSSLKRMSSLGKRPKSPRINTGNAVAAMAFQAGALGAGASVSGTGNSSPTAWPKNIIKRTRSRSELSVIGTQGQASSSTTDLGRPGLAAMWTKQGGPPMPTLATPLKNEETLNSLGDGDDDDDDDVGEETGITMDLSIRPDSIVPTLEGFKSNIRELNPRLPMFMFDRIAQEQLRRFKKLMDSKIKHAQAISNGACASGKHCAELGGEPTYLPSKSSSREPGLPHTGFPVAGLVQSDEEINALADGIVTPAQFPPGVPLPPVKRLPAEFECSLCFKVKKFQKPSDWSKHVHEDVQPFTCTFANCAEPKSFKRKADWVRHENERHRQLEWWICNINDCSHKCYRKDNFVQHLVREHKLPEPKVKTTKTGKPAVRGPSSQKVRNRHADDGEESNGMIDRVWMLVDECRHETTKNPKEEACKFCGNICNSWKKLTVHLAKHMEQISMPVLGVVKQREVTPETIISPIEQRVASQHSSMSPQIQSPFSQNTQGNPMQAIGGSVKNVNPLPGSLTSAPQPNYFRGMDADHEAINYQRVSPQTYPPPGNVGQFVAAYRQGHGGGTRNPNFGTYTGSPAPQSDLVNASNVLPYGHTSGPENTYGGGNRAPTFQPRMSPYDEGSGFQYVSQQQAHYASPMEENLYQYGNSTPTSYFPPTTSSASYPGQQPMGNAPTRNGQQQSSRPSQIPMRYIASGPMSSQVQASRNAATYGTQQRQQQQQQQQQFAFSKP